MTAAVPAGGGEPGVAELLVRRQGGPADRVRGGPRRGRRRIRVRRGVPGVSFRPVGLPAPGSGEPCRCQQRPRLGNPRVTATR